MSVRAGQCIKYKSLDHSDSDGSQSFDTYEVGYMEPESVFVALLDNTDAETEEDEA